MIDKDTLLEALEKECQLADSMDEIKVVLGLTKAIYIVSQSASADPEPKLLTLDELRERIRKPVWIQNLLSGEILEVINMTDNSKRQEEGSKPSL